MRKGDSNADKMTKILLVIYLVVLGWIILFKLGVQFSYMEERKLNLILFSNGYYSTMEIILNVVIFVPLGIYLGILLKEKSLFLKLLSFFLVSLILEGLQYCLKIGTFDITDLLTNTTGGIIGYLLFLAGEKLISNRDQTQNFFNSIAGIGTIAIVLLLILLKLNMLPIKYQ
ncbi:VanZ family protein [Algoriphagus sp.]|uniref:VanZ family protein n=1 Tax=Algoriphagus sp. TaxID=1872435 RepID=UPI0025E5E7DB|nr:VanZ family protein [Algoriphagus sp.]